VFGQELKGIAPIIFTPPTDIANLEAVKIETTTGTLVRHALCEVCQKLSIATPHIQNADRGRKRTLLQLGCQNKG
jgi:hypothetical protein